MSAREFYDVVGVELPAGGPNVATRCFAAPDAHSHGDRSASMSVNVESGVFNCFACEAKGGPYDAALALGREPRDAMELLERFGLREPSEPQTNGAKPPPSLDISTS